MVDPSCHFSLGSMMTAVNVAFNLTTWAQTVYNLYTLATGDQEITAKQIDFEILAGMASVASCQKSSGE
jgi:hypothetical protein